MFYLEKNLLLSFHQPMTILSLRKEKHCHQRKLSLFLRSMQNVPIYRQFLTFKEKTYKNTEQLSIYIRSKLNI